jgi:hypothetical protein
MHARPVLSDRSRRTEAVIEVLRRRAALRRSRGKTIPPALQHAIDDYDRHRQPPARDSGSR